MLGAQRAIYGIYSRLPASLQDAVFAGYLGYLERVPVGPTPRRDFVQRFFDSQAEYRRYVTEYEQRAIGDEIAAARAEHRRRTGHGRFAAINRFTPERFYAFVRKRQPDVLVETGVCNGVSTLVVLRALEYNDRGHLHSVDLPDADRLPAEADPGWIVPDELRDRWSLTTGRSQEVLPSALEGIGSVDVFVHDSIAPILPAEFDHVWPLLREGGVILADDIFASDAFDAIAARDDVIAGTVAPNVGYAVKRSPAG